MESIEEKAYTTYTKNLNYFNVKQPHIAKLLNVFEMALNKGDYQAQFDLEYKDNYFDVKDLNSKKYLYGTNSLEISKELVQSFDFKKEHQTFEGIPIYNLPSELLENPEEDIELMLGVLNIMQYYSQNHIKDATMNTIDKCILIGTGLGLHIPILHKKILAKQYIIVEDNLELFKLSLFTTNYYEIANNAELYFSVSDDENLFLQTMGSFLNNQFFYNRHLKYLKFPSHSNEKIKQTQNALINQGFISFPYKATLFKNIKPFEFMNDGYNLLDVGKNFSTSVFAEKPTLIVAAGPSFQKNIEWLKDNHSKFIVIAVSATLNTLRKYNIKPDIVTQLDGSDLTVDYYGNKQERDFLKNTIMLFGANVPVQIREMFKKEQIFYFDEGNNYISDITSVTSPCIGSVTLLLSLFFSAKSTYLLGLDLAINQETGETHSSDHLYSKKSDLRNKDSLSCIMENENNLFSILGNFSETVYTNALLHSSVQSLYRNIPNVKKEKQNIYNMNEGANIRLCKPQKIENIKINELLSIDKKELNQKLKSVFLKNSIQTLNSVDFENIKLRLIDAKETYKKLQEYSNSVSHSNKERYLYDLLGFVSYVLHKQSRESTTLSLVFLLFFKYSLTTVLDFFNSKEIKNSKRHIKKFDKLIQKEMYSIVEIYIEALESFIEKKASKEISEY